ncbi:hypothetical protein [Latilactobacillus phage TMW 1.1397 P1]|nr:hypothetical protein [Latilactobacillus phage TMW 1.1397 P1]
MVEIDQFRTRTLRATFQKQIKSKNADISSYTDVIKSKSK